MVRRSRLFICMFFLISLNKINALIVFEFSDRFCFMSCFQNVSSPKMRNVLMLQGRLWFLGALCTVLPSVLWRCWLGGRKGIWPVKNEWWGADVVICLEWGADLHMVQLMPLPLTVSCFSKIQTGFTFLVPAHPGRLGKRAVKCVYVCLYCKKSIAGHLNSSEVKRL